MEISIKTKKMRMSFLFLAAIMVLGFAACSDDVKNAPEVDTGQMQGYLTLSLAGNANSRTAEGSEGNEAGAGNENVINNVTVLFTNSGGLITSKRHPSITGGVTESFKVDVGTHYVYVLVNDPGITVIENTTNINDLVETVANAVDGINGFKGGSFMMVNARNNSTEIGGAQVNINTTNTISNPAKVTIKVDRVAVKIVDITGDPAVSALAAKTNNFVTGVDVKGYGLLNVRKEFNVLQKWGMDNYGGDVLAYEVLTGVQLDAVNSVKDNFFLHIGTYTEIVKNISTMEVEEINVLSTAGNYTSTDKYMIENRPEIKFYGIANVDITAGRGETSGVIYRVQAKNGSGDLPTFYVYRDVVYENLTALQANSEFASTDLSLLTPGQLRAKGIRVYEDGIMYYSYFIKDPNTLHTYGGDDYYGVFRNSVYKLNVNSIKDLGDDVPGGGTVDPNEPGEPENPDIDTEEAYIQVTVTINPWVLNVIDIDF
jgi:hypothetical protein